MVRKAKFKDLVGFVFSFDGKYFKLIDNGRCSMARKAKFKDLVGKEVKKILRGGKKKSPIDKSVSSVKRKILGGK